MKKKYEFKFDFAEKDVENALISNMDGYLGLRFIRSQWNTPAGVIEIIAKSEKVDGRYFVIEVKKGKIDSHAFCQVHRYATYLNHAYSKEGKRHFIPMLIGDELADELEKCVKYYDVEHPYAEYGCTYYRIFNLDIHKGLQTNLANKAQIEYERHVLGAWSYVTDLQFKIYQLEEQLENAPFKYDVFIAKQEMLLSDAQKAEEAKNDNRYKGKLASNG